MKLLPYSCLKIQPSNECVIYIETESYQIKLSVNIDTKFVQIYLCKGEYYLQQPYMHIAKQIIWGEKLEENGDFKYTYFG